MTTVDKITTIDKMTAVDKMTDVDKMTTIDKMTTADKKGSLTIAGSGIASIRHITLETLSYIESSDKIYYALTDPATEAFVLDKSKGDCVDLSIYYDKEKNRYESYVQMCEVCRSPFLIPSQMINKSGL